jgi:hypothetical protein
MNESDDKLAREAKALFDESVDELDAATLSTLNRGRHAALEASGKGRSVWLRWAPGLGVTAVIVVTVIMATPRPDALDAVPASDIDILLGEESIEMLEDLEFYAWMELQDGEVG